MIHASGFGIDAVCSGGSVGKELSQGKLVAMIDWIDWLIKVLLMYSNVNVTAKQLWNLGK